MRRHARGGYNKKKTFLLLSRAYVCEAISTVISAGSLYVVKRGAEYCDFCDLLFRQMEVH
jgi:hypothetical protein